MRASHGSAEQHRRLFWRKQLVHTSIALALLSASLGLGMWGYEHFEHLHWRDAFLNAAMILSGMGPVKTDLSEPGKLFAGAYALYSGLVVIAIAGLVLAPGVHSLMHRVHWDESA